jgi:hypothetical protein
MNLLRLRSGEGSLEEGTPKEVAEKKRRALMAAVRPKRLEVARSNAKWTEIPNDLVPRNQGRWLVSAETDAIYTLFRGTVFAPLSVNVVANLTELSFYVDSDGDLVFLERLPGKWSEHVERQARRGATRERSGAA